MAKKLLVDKKGTFCNNKQKSGGGWEACEKSSDKKSTWEERSN